MTHDEMVARVQTKFPHLLDDTGWPSDGPLVPADQHFELAAFLKNDLGFTLYITVVASHWPGSPDAPEGPVPETHQIATVLRRPSKPATAVRWRVDLPVSEPLATLVPLFAGADWQEREQFDLVGVRFSGHPDLRRLMLSEDWEGHPLRKDYAIDTPHHPWR